MSKVVYQEPGSSSPETVRYLRMEYALVTGWRVGSDTMKMSDYLAAF